MMNTVARFLSNHTLPERQLQEDQYIASLDPLQADELLKQLPLLNQNQDTIALVLLLVDLLPSIPDAESFDYFESAAAMRDIGMLLGSLKRHGIEPVNVIPQLEEKLNILANHTNLPPRDTLLHYTVWNPEGERCRTFTGTHDELCLINSVRIAMNPLLRSIQGLLELHHLPFDGEAFSLRAEQVVIDFDGMIEGIVHAKRFVSPQYFATELRHYFDAVMLNERMYIGPGAVEMPVFVFDQLLWSADCQDKVYQEFRSTYVPYIQASVREIFHAFESKLSLVTRMNDELENYPTYSMNLQNSAKALLKLNTRLRSFRMPHKKVAEAAYNHTEERKRDKGSGGYSTDILSHILELMTEHFEALEDNLRDYVVRHQIKHTN